MNSPDKVKKRHLEEEGGGGRGGGDIKKSSSHNEANQALLNRLAGPSSGKAGLIRDPQEVANIIYEASKGTPFFENEKKRSEQLAKQIETTLAHLQRETSLRNGDLSREEVAFEKICDSVESTRILDQTVVVVDADAFFASVEELRDPSIKGKAFGVGKTVLSTASYEARRYGARSGMAGHIAKKLCPHLIFVKAHYDDYKKYSDLIFDILRCYDPDLSPASLDEAYMNITNYLDQHNNNQTPAQVVQEMRDRIKAETGLSVSAGVAPNKMLAKIAADVNKPDGQWVIEPTKEACMEFMHGLSVRKVPGIGRVKQEWLSALDVKMVKDIWTQRGKLHIVETLIGLDHLIHAYLGIGSTVVQVWGREDRQSISSEATFSAISISDKGALYAKLDEISSCLAGDITKLGYVGRTITLKMKLDTFEVITRSKTKGANLYYDGCSETLFKVGKELFDKEQSVRRSSGSGSNTLGVRLIGLRLSNLRDENVDSKTSLDMWIEKKSNNNKEKQDDVLVELDEDDIEKVIQHQLSQPDEDQEEEEEEEIILLDEEEGNGEGNEEEFKNDDKFGENGEREKAILKRGRQLVCPVCGNAIKVNSRNEETRMMMFNSHLDECLFLKQYGRLERKDNDNDDTDDAFKMMMRSSTSTGNQQYSSSRSSSNNIRKKKKKKKEH